MVRATAASWSSSEPTTHGGFRSAANQSRRIVICLAIDDAKRLFSHDIEALGLLRAGNLAGSLIVPFAATRNEHAQVSQSLGSSAGIMSGMDFLPCAREDEP